jgi:hypothetical protein
MSWGVYLGPALEPVERSPGCMAVTTAASTQV